MGGIIRGAVAFALAKRFHGDGKDLLVGTVLGVVVSTTILVGTILPL